MSESAILGGLGLHMAPGLRPSRKQPPVVTVDLDSTLCDTSHRHHMLPPKDQRDGFDWREYSAACTDDAPVAGVIRLVQLLADFYGIIVVSARRDEARVPTTEWLNKHLGVEPFRVVLDDLPLEREFVHSQYKAVRIKELQKEGFQVLLHIDDWQEVEQPLAELGVPSLIVTPPWLNADLARVAGAAI